MNTYEHRAQGWDFSGCNFEAGPTNIPNPNMFQNGAVPNPYMNPYYNFSYSIPQYTVCPVWYAQYMAASHQLARLTRLKDSSTQVSATDLSTERLSLDYPQAHPPKCNKKKRAPSTGSIQSDRRIYACPAAGANCEMIYTNNVPVACCRRRSSVNGTRTYRF